MNTQEILFRYASALFKSTPKEKWGEYLNYLEHFDKVFTRKITYFFNHPLVPIADKKKVLKDIFTRLSSGANSVIEQKLYHFFCLLLDKKRFLLVHSIIQTYRELTNDQLGIVEGRLISPFPMDSSSKEKIQNRLENFFKKKIKLQEERDPKLIGGAALIIANKLIDFSIKGKLERLKKHLTTKE